MPILNININTGKVKVVLTFFRSIYLTITMFRLLNTRLGGILKIFTIHSLMIYSTIMVGSCGVFTIVIP